VSLEYLGYLRLYTNNFKGDADVNVSVVAQNLLTVKMAGRSFGRKQNYGLTVTVSSKEWCPVKHATRTPHTGTSGVLMSYVVNPAKELWNETGLRQVGLEPRSNVEQLC
jgi:hypothetical protein